ncbi:Insulinase (Peptidase family M16) family protein [Klebsormidium nitens]|uniref:Insulinase (Peptidase family M16) family protein n=1 Tax=Klebsormidium nitens TaxID=105231 RepID=A0A1Y1I718_KLENI|nr:Insulinase (Peptidase family M16) family protein [Klebsormidium nitens]|eukprot:GAQ85219.1 Insulinase (Peptidase family M16) family protein [Klebsormidium nitens]
MAVNVVSPSSAGDIIKSAEDKKLYRRLVLDNGLTVVLIHDPEMAEKLADPAADRNGESVEESEEADSDEDEDDNEWESDEDEMDDDESGSDEEAGEGDKKKEGHGGASKKAAAAMCVGVGSFSDPMEAQGLAHFLEHMLFMGSQKFPDENEYDSYLSKHGGGSNAFTEAEYTCFHFDVNRRFLQGALDRFAQFFINPLAKVEAMDREVQSVDSEFNQVLQDDNARLQQLHCSTADVSHPFHKFMWGNKKSLSGGEGTGGPDMRSLLMKLYLEHYRADRMHLAVLGGDSLDTLEEWVTKLFSPIRGQGGPRPSFLPPPGAPPAYQPGLLYKVESVRDQNLLSLTWQLPCLDAHYQAKPADYVSHLIGHEGAGSLLSLLKAKGWATGLSAGVGDGGLDRSTACYMFEAHIWLSVLGLEKVYDVIGLLYQYVAMLRREGPQEWVFRELQAIAEMDFRFAEEREAEDCVVSVAHNMSLYQPEHTLYGDYIYRDWDPRLVTDVLDRLTPSNMRVDIVTQHFDASAPGVLKEPWFEVPYTVEPLPNDLLQTWSQPPGVDSALKMPPRNEYIPLDFSLRAEKEPEKAGANGAAAANGVGGRKEGKVEPPVVIHEDESLKLWFKQDTQFKTPRANMYFSITSPVAHSSVDNCVMTELFVKLVEDALNETLYLANVAKLDSSIAIHADKFELRVGGFSDKLLKLVSRLFTELRRFEVRPDRFLVMREASERGYRNVNMKPLKHSAYLRLALLKERHWPFEDRLAALGRITAEDVRKFVPSLFEKTFVEVLAHGNLTRSEALQLVGIVKEAFPGSPLSPEERPVERILRLPEGVQYLHEVETKNDAEENSVVEMYYQVGLPRKQSYAADYALVDLLEQLAYEPFYDQLRTKEQLGYRVDCGVRATHRVLGFCFRVQSADYAPDHLHKRGEAFLTTFRKQLADMPADEFDEHRESLIDEKLQKDHALREESDRFWEQIWEPRYMFDARQQEAAALQTVTKEQVLEWFDEHIAQTSGRRKRLSIHVWGRKAAEKQGGIAAVQSKQVEVAGDEKLVRTLDGSELRTGLEFFPVPELTA